MPKIVAGSMEWLQGLCQAKVSALTALTDAQAVVVDERDTAAVLARDIQVELLKRRLNTALAMYQDGVRKFISTKPDSDALLELVTATVTASASKMDGGRVDGGQALPAETIEP